VEPLVFGRGTGVTPIAVIGSTIFWTWLWGPVGLLIAMPITVCLAVLGKHVEGLEFFEVLLGDKPALTPAQSFYQRALTGDAAEATYQAELCLKEQSLETYLNDVVLAGLRLAKQDERRGALDDDQAGRIAHTVSEMLINLADFEPRRWFSSFRTRQSGQGDGEEQHEDGLASLDAAQQEIADYQPILDKKALLPEWRGEGPVLVIGGLSILDEAAGAMLAQLLEKRGLGAKALGPDSISAGHITTLSDSKARLVCLSYLGLDSGPAHIRYLVRRLRRILPDALVLVVYWGEDEGDPAMTSLTTTAEADAYATSLPQALDVCVKAAKGEPIGDLKPNKDTKPAANKSPTLAVTPPPERAASGA
jgi:hypothetical protein